jgi:aryl-alcohol dehydrogenase-like predicted oxidoreductase
MIYSKLSIGTAQFGMTYGVANKFGKVHDENMVNILDEAHIAGIDSIDTAMVYGDAESRLGSCMLDDWQIVTKLPPIPPNTEEILDWVLKMVQGSLIRLQQAKLYALLLHRPNDLIGPHGKALYKALLQLKAEGLVCKIGVSIYAEDELTDICSRYAIDLIQVPFNIFDRRIVSSGLLERLSLQGIEVHTRSSFLQGLLLMPLNIRPTKFQRWQNLWTLWDEWLLDNNISPLAACVRFALSQTGIDRVVIGVDNPEQFQEILAAANGKMPEIPANLFSNDPNLINPAKWADL